MSRCYSIKAFAPNVRLGTIYYIMKTNEAVQCKVKSISFFNCETSFFHAKVTLLTALNTTEEYIFTPNDMIFKKFSLKLYKSIEDIKKNNHVPYVNADLFSIVEELGYVLDTKLDNYNINEYGTYLYFWNGVAVRKGFIPISCMNFYITELGKHIEVNEDKIKFANKFSKYYKTKEECEKENTIKVVSF